MFKHLKYIDGTSDKFWQIQTAGLTHTVTYGRNGTDGQSKDKSFDSEEACLKDAEKLVADKIKKGYSEDGTVDTHTQVKTSNSRQPTAGAQRKAEAIAAIKMLISEGKSEDILPFLDQYASGNMEALKKEIRAAKRYWLDYTDLSKDPQYRSKAQYNWGVRGTKQQQRIVKLLALATFSGSDVGNWDLFYELLEQVKSKDVADILAYAKPNWVGPYLLQLVKRNDWQRISYINLRHLEELGYVTFEPELYASSISGFSMQQTDVLFNMLTEDKLTIERDIPLVFSYETSIEYVYCHHSYQNKDHELLWDKVFSHLLAAQKIDPEMVIIGSLEAQTKNWNNNLKSYFRKLISGMQLPEDKVLAYQHHFFPLLHAEQSSVINFTVDYLKPFFSHVDFHLSEFLDWAEGLFMRNDVKTSIKTLIIQFDKLAKKMPALQERFLSLVADVFMVPDLSLQERAAKFILKYQQEYSEELSLKLTTYQSQMMGTVAVDLKALLPQENYTEEELLSVLQGEEAESYVYEPLRVKRLQEAYDYPATWNDILFKIGEVIGGVDSIQVEILMNAWIQHSADFPADYQKQLEPYIKQLHAYHESSWYNHFSAVFVHLYHQPHQLYKHKDRYSNYSKWVSLMGRQLDLLQCLLIDGVRLPLLSLPTHKPFWIAPSILIQRILAYQDADVAIDLLDLSIALSRTVREDMGNVEEQLQLIKDQQVRAVLHYALGFDTVVQAEQRSWLSNLISTKDSDHSKWSGVWATVARTHHADRTFEEFANGPLKHVPFAVKPYRPTLKVEATYYKNYNYATQKKEDVYNGDQLSYAFPNYSQGVDTFLYHHDIFTRGNKMILSYYIHQADVPYMHSLMPQNTESLSMFLTIGFNSKSDVGGKSTTAYLKEMLYDFFRFDEQSDLYLATSMFNKEKEVRAMAAEVLLSAIAENRLDVATVGAQVGMLLSHGYGPIGRCVEVLQQCRDVSAKHNNALLQLLDAALVNYSISEQMPTNFKKVIEYYYDLMSKEHYVYPNNLHEVFEKLTLYKSLQPILKKIRS